MKLQQTLFEARRTNP